MPGDAALDVLHSSGERSRILLEPLPFRIGRGPENHLVLRDSRASRTHAWIVFDEQPQGPGAYFLEDLESTHGTWVDGTRIHGRTKLENGNAIHFGFEDAYGLVFSRKASGRNRLVEDLATDSPSSGATSRFARLRSFISVARTLQSSPAINDVLGAVVDAAIALTGAERGFVLLRSGSALELRVGQDSHGFPLSQDDLNVPASVLLQALKERRELLFMNLALQQPSLEFGNVICVPLIQFRNLDNQQTLALSSQNDTVGVIYLDSRQQQWPLSDLNRELLHTLALEASTVLENAKLLEEERQKLLLERELAVAREIQRSLLPGNLPDEGWFCAAGSNLPSDQVSGDYFDVRSVGSTAWGAVVADVSGKGVSSALLASLLQGAFLLASELAMPLDMLMSKINAFLNERTKGEKYATLFYATFHQSGEMAWANAGHCAPLLVRSNGQMEELSPTGMPLGLRASADFQIRQQRLAPGDTIVAFSDGLTETENSSKQTFGSVLKSSLAVPLGRTAQEIHDQLVQSFRAFVGTGTPQDDVTVLVLQYQGQ